MSDSSSYTEFKLSVTVYSLESANEGPCKELAEICQLIGSSPPSVSPVEQYPRINPLVLASKDDTGEFLSIDMQAEPTDQMEVVTVSVRCKNATAEAVRERLRQIHSRSEVETALLQGNLGLVLEGTNPYEAPSPTERTATRSRVAIMLLFILGVFGGSMVIVAVICTVVLIVRLPAFLQHWSPPYSGLFLRVAGDTVAYFVFGFACLLAARTGRNERWVIALAYVALGAAVFFLIQAFLPSVE